MKIKQLPIFLITLSSLCINSIINSNAQSSLYENRFPLSDIKLLDSPFKHAMELNINTLLSYDADRLLAPYLKEAGLEPKGVSFSCWDGLDGHVGGHYLSALAIHYAASGDKECKKRMEYVIEELKRCQSASANGYLGGVPNSKPLWNKVSKGEVSEVWNYWVPWYNIHKMYAGLRDAWLYGGSEDAKTMFLKFCDWGVELISNLSDEQMEQMLANEFGGINETFADAYAISGDERYLEAAKRFSHRILYDSMLAHKDNLDNMHANTQVPKAVGYQRVGEVCSNSDFTSAADFFWNTVVDNRSLAFGGNSRREHFPSTDDCLSYIDDREGPESCNTYNMLRLSEGLFRIKGDAKYADYYERAMYNHILSTQHPTHGGYVYFTSARPAHYRVYSAPNSAMWCCVGTGMENHGKYSEFIYTHNGDSLFVNLFIASQLNWREKNISIEQTTNYPFDTKTTLRITTDKKKRATILFRHPFWCEKLEIKINGKEYKQNSAPSSYLSVDREWKNGDIIELQLPMSFRLESMPNVENYVAIMRGPILMAAQAGTEELVGLIADSSRMAHIAHGALFPTFKTPQLIGSNQDIVATLNKLSPINSKPLNFTLPNSMYSSPKYNDLTLEPFFGVHDCRYIIYWRTQESRSDAQRLEEQERAMLELDNRTVDAISTGEQQPESDHFMEAVNSSTGSFNGEVWREAKDGGYLCYTLSTKGKGNLNLMLRYWGNEDNGHSFDIYIDNQILTTEDNAAWKWRKEDFVNVEYRIPTELLKDKSSIKVTLKPKPQNSTGGIYYIRLIN